MTADTARRRLGLRPLIGNWDDPIITSDYRLKQFRQQDRERRLAMHKRGKIPPLVIWRAS